MTHSTERDDQPLDPAQADVVRRMRRLMLFSTLIMIGGFIVVFGAIGYRLSTASERNELVETSVRLPKGARVLSTAVSDGRLVVTVETAGITEVRIFDLGTLQSRGRLSFDPAP